MTLPEYPQTFMIVTLVIYNLAIVVLILIFLLSINLGSMLRDKKLRKLPSPQMAFAQDAAFAASTHSAVSNEAMKTAVTASQAAAADRSDALVNALAVTAAASAKSAAETSKTISDVAQAAHTGISSKDLTDDGSSFSRLTGAIGLAVIACFVWGLGNAVIYNAYLLPDRVQVMLQNVSTFILTCSALFAPYAFNQLSTIFTPKTK